MPYILFLDFITFSGKANKWIHSLFTMTLLEDAKEIFARILGPECDKILSQFDKPDTYPGDFLDECEFFLSRLIGEAMAIKQILPLKQKYLSHGKT